jgi:hypothetical protein
MACVRTRSAKYEKNKRSRLTAATTASTRNHEFRLSMLVLGVVAVTEATFFLSHGLSLLLGWLGQGRGRQLVLEREEIGGLRCERISLWPGREGGGRQKISVLVLRKLGDERALLETRSVGQNATLTRRDAMINAPRRVRNRVTHVGVDRGRLREERWIDGGLGKLPKGGVDEQLALRAETDVVRGGLVGKGGRVLRKRQTGHRSTPLPLVLEGQTTGTWGRRRWRWGAAGVVAVADELVDVCLAPKPEPRMGSGSGGPAHPGTQPLTTAVGAPASIFRSRCLLRARRLSGKRRVSSANARP